MIGDRIELLHIDDRYTDLKPGDKGTVKIEDSLGTIHCEWDNGSSLGLIRNHDYWRVIS